MLQNRRFMNMLVLVMSLIASAHAQTQREVAVTFDDLPLSRMNPKNMREVTARLVAQITTHKIPAIGFVNESKLYDRERLDSSRVALLQMWLDAGLELGNHSYSHPDLHRISTERYKAEVLQGEKVTAKLLAEQGRKPRYFRHPYLHTGTSLSVKKEIETFLAEHGYAVAPVSVDNSEWIFAHAYALAMEKNDASLMQRVGAAYVPYMEEKFVYYEKLSRELFGYEIKQTLLLHANALNADYLDELAAMLARRGYAFITLEAALRDPAYGSEDTYIGSAGMSWLQRWAMSTGKSGEFFKGEPKAPAFVLEAAGMDSE